MNLSMAVLKTKRNLTGHIYLFFPNCQYLLKHLYFKATVMSDEEYDYMSDAFLTESVKEDVRPGLVNNRTTLRLHNIQKKKEVTDEENKLRNRPHRVVEAEKREEGLQAAIDGSNRGFALLQKMGYKPGTAIGKTGAGRLDPIPITVKSDRQGLGRDSVAKRLAAEMAAMREHMRKSREAMMNIDTYRSRMTQKVIERQIAADFKKSQRICYQLDLNAGYNEPVESWFWPERDNLNAYEGSKDDDDEEDDEAEYPKRHKNNTKTCDLEGDEEEEEDDYEEEEEEEERDEQDYDDYKNIVDSTSKTDNKEEESACDTLEECEFEPPKKLEIITTYLRETYFYCVWCGVEYDDDKDLRDSCPGPTHDAH